MAPFWHQYLLAIVITADRRIHLFGPYEVAVFCIPERWITHMETGYFARRLIQLGAPLTSRDRDGETPLHTATVSRNELVIRLLVKAGADINVLDYRGLAPLHHACKDENTHIAQVLIRAGADLNQPNRPMGDTPLLMALRIGYRPMVAILLDAGVDVNRANASGDTPLAVAQGWPCVVEWLKLYGAR